MRPTPFQAFVRIMIGCDKFCTYCIVPSVRGPEQSRPAAAHPGRSRANWPTKAAARSRCWARRSTATGTPTAAAPARLVRPARPSCTTSTGIERLKFVTNYPKDMTDDLLQAVRDLPKCLALPARAGPERLERGAEADEARLHGRGVPRDAGPHPRDDSRRGRDQRLHRRLLRRDRGRLSSRRSTWSASARFKNSFIFKYSERPGTKGAELYPDDVPEEVKKRRNNELLAMQNAISEEDNQPLIGRQVEVLVEGPSKNGQKARRQTADVLQLIGRTHCDRIVVFDGNRRQIGQMLAGRDLRRQRLHAVRQRGHGARRAGSVSVC